MKKEDLKVGNVIELRDGNKFIVIVKFDDVEFDLVSLKGNLLGKLSGFNENLQDYGNHNFDIVKVYEDYTCQKVLWKRKEEQNLTEDEKVILRNLPKKYRYITRDKISESMLCIFIDKPKKESLYWFSDNYVSLEVFNHLFQFIEWEDEEPYLISDLLGEEK